MHSCLYECRVMHARLAPKRHRFAYRILLLGLDLDELDSLSARLRLFSRNRRNLYSFWDRDYLPTDEPVFNGRNPTEGGAGSDLKRRVVTHLARHGIDLSGGRVMLVSLPRVCGYVFNPVSFYFCFGRSGAPVAALAEVTNTFREMKPYVIPLRSADGEGAAASANFHRRVPKHFYVSPFSDVDVAFDFTLAVPDARLAVRIDDYTRGERSLTSTLTGTRVPLTDGRLAWFFLKYPLPTLRVIGLIHWHAFRLWWKRVPWFAKAARAADQRELYRPHASLTAARPAGAPAPVEFVSPPS